MKYSFYERNHNPDNVYYTRLKLIEKHKIDIHSSSKMYAYYMEAKLGIILLSNCQDKINYGLHDYSV